MSEFTSSPGSHRHPSMQNRRLSSIQDGAVDDLHDINTHALDDKSPPPHHESSVMSYMESHSPNDENSHKCIPRSPLLSRNNSLGDDEKAEMVSERNAPRDKGSADEPSTKSSHSDLEVEDAHTPEAAVDVRRKT